MYVQFTGHIRALQPIFVSVPDGNGATVHTIPVRDEMGQRSVHVALTGNNIKGALRSVGGSAALVDVHGGRVGVEGGMSVLSLSAFADSKHGGIMGAGERSLDDIIELRRMRDRNAHMALFGSMPLQQTGRVHVDHAISEDPIGRRGSETDPLYTERSARRDPFRRDPELLNAFPEEQLNDYLDHMGDVKETSAMRTKLRELERDRVKLRRNKEGMSEEDRSRLLALDAEIDELTRKKDKHLKESGGESVGRKLDPFDAIAPGVLLRHEIRLVNVNDLELGYFMLCLKHFAYAGCAFGGRQGKGFGRCEMRYQIKINEGGFEDVDAGTLVVAPRKFELETSHPAFAVGEAALAAARADPSQHFDLTVLDDFRPAARADPESKAAKRGHKAEAQAAAAQ